MRSDEGERKRGGWSLRKRRGGKGRGEDKGQEKGEKLDLEIGET